MSRLRCLAVQSVLFVTALFAGFVVLSAHLAAAELDICCFYACGRLHKNNAASAENWLLPNRSNNFDSDVGICAWIPNGIRLRNWDKQHPDRFRGTATSIKSDEN